MTTAELRGLCPPPFFQEQKFGNATGLIAGRFCQAITDTISCCLPCPSTDFFYPDNFRSVTQAASWVNVAGVVCCIFLLLSFAALPVEKTHRHYLSICLAVAVIFMHLGFVIPLAAKPEQCADQITPNDMHSSKECALSGSFLLAGGWAGVMWVFLRALSLHLQICWQRTMGKSFMWGSFVAGWGIPAIALAMVLVFSGVSFRFGDTCHVNHANSLADFWIPLLIFAGATVIIQFATFGYCIKVYISSLSDDSNTTNSSGLPSYTNSVRTMSPRQAYRRVRRVIELQWRGIAIVLLIIADVIFFAVVFVFMDTNENAAVRNKESSQPWINCIVANPTDKNKCLPLVSKMVVNEATVMAVLLLLSLNGVWLFFLMGRFSMFTGWYELIHGKIRPNKEFISVDATRTPAVKDPRSYEMLSGSGRDKETPARTPDTLLTPISPAAGKGGRATPDYFGREANYQHPTNSFSRPSLRAEQGVGYQQWGPSTGGGGSYQNPLSMNKI